MNLSAPKQATFYVAAVLWLLGLLGPFVAAIGSLPLGIAGQSASWTLAILGGLVLIIGNAMDGI